MDQKDCLHHHVSSFDVEGVFLNRNKLALDGHLMKYLEERVKSVIQVEAKYAEVIGTHCILTSATITDYLKLTIRITHQSEAFLTDYETKDCKNSIILWDKLSKGIKEALNDHYGLVVQIYLEGWSNGSVIIKLSLENLETSRLEDVKNIVSNLLQLELPSCNVELAAESVEPNRKSEIDISLNVKTDKELSNASLEQINEVARECKNFLVENSNENNQADERMKSKSIKLI